MQMLSQTHSYLSRIRAAQGFISIDPNLLRIPEVVLERIEIKIEDDPPIKTVGKEAPILGELQVKSEKQWKTEKRDPPEESVAAPCCSPAGTDGGTGYQGAEDSTEYNRETAPAKPGGNGQPGKATSRSGCNGLSRQIGRNPGRRKRGGWRQYVFRDRQQFDRKMKKIHNAAYVEEERQRGQRFSEEENRVLVESVLSHYKELCGYSALKGSASRKKRLWQEVVNKVNSIGATYRTIEVCKKRYGDCKRAVKVKMAALEHQAMGGIGPPEQIRFNHWEEKLRQKIVSVTMNAAQRVLDTCKPSSLEDPNSIAPSTPQQCSSWAPIIDTSAPQMTHALTCEPVSDYDEASSPADIHLIGEWSEEEAPCTPAAHEAMNGADLQAEYKLPAPLDITIGPEPSVSEQHYQLQEDRARILHHLKQAGNAELHKLRENVVEGNARMVQQLEGLASEVRELNAHVQQIHMNQTHFNHMFQNYMSDTKQFYGAIVQAIKALQPAPTVSPMVSPPSSPKYPAAQSNPSQVLETAAMFDSTSMSPAGSAEPASASSTASEFNPSSQRRTAAMAFQSRPRKKH
ncbi:uncharacterized protein [Dendrobates tinctorius]|uniref:uncharacterized protein isoform X2 n=1 Tax=Dendrobates tinctorius TaxID=92724 RepID=UPI003CCA2CD6